MSNSEPNTYTAKSSLHVSSYGSLGTRAMAADEILTKLFNELETQHYVCDWLNS